MQHTCNTVHMHDCSRLAEHNIYFPESITKLFFAPQTAHNRHEAKFSMCLPENGHLTPPTYQFLRQAFLTIYASMLRLEEEGKEGGTGRLHPSDGGKCLLPLMIISLYM